MDDHTVVIVTMTSSTPVVRRRHEQALDAILMRV